MSNYFHHLWSLDTHIDSRTDSQALRAEYCIIVLWAFAQLTIQPSSLGLLSEDGTRLCSVCFFLFVILLGDWWLCILMYVVLLHRPFCERSILCFAHVSFFFQLTFSDVCKPTFSKLFHMPWLCSKKKRSYADFINVPVTKMRDDSKNPKFRIISRLIATYYAPSLVVRKENRKSKTIVFISDY